MVYVKLPTMSLDGEWSVSDPEPLVAERLLSALPAPPLAEADPQTRWGIVYDSLLTAQDVMHDHMSLLFGDRESVTQKSGRVEMINMFFAIGPVLHAIRTYRGFQQHRLLLDARARQRRSWRERWRDRLSSRGGGTANETASSMFYEQLVELERDVAELRRLLREAAG
ncbi:hypothetical protein [Streptomyces litchfieldiae]|uniref:Uncharacterized protein n=1 Tax=Streptomyces litchfieldiae TaxID=3075543 RepID=A0ABU2MYN9_9ACTN|nr:hypothetical protein [Streptomyces sp. DSM 44938]MDT0346772.1 hypothetical protein [Streptomyces sp. DSM 44938]